MTRRPLHAAATVLLLVLVLPAVAFAHPELSPAVAVPHRLQLYTLAVPTEKSGASTSAIALTVPRGFAIDSFAPPPPGWRMREQQRGSGESAVVTKVTWTGGRTPTGEDSVFSFLAEAARPGTYRFVVRQTYSDGSIVDWAGPESSESPAPAITVGAAPGGGGGSGGGTSVLSIVAVVLAALALAASGLALLGPRGGRPLV